MTGHYSLSGEIQSRTPQFGPSHLSLAIEKKKLWEIPLKETKDLIPPIQEVVKLSIYRCLLSSMAPE
jgi:hypothetical protein